MTVAAQHPDVPSTVVLEFCPECGRRKPAAWGPTETECFGRWRSNVPNRDGKTSEHEPAAFVSVVYARCDVTFDARPLPTLVSGSVRLRLLKNEVELGRLEVADGKAGRVEYVLPHGGAMLAATVGPA